MPAESKSIKKDFDGKPAPQYFNPDLDDYEYLHGRNNAAYHTLLGPDGTSISHTGGKLNVRASELETLLGTLGTESTLAGILTKLGDGTLRAAPAGPNIVPVQEPGSYTSVAAGDDLSRSIDVSDCKAVVVATILQEQFKYRVDLWWEKSDGAVFGGSGTSMILDSQIVGNRVSGRVDVLTPKVQVRFFNEDAEAHNVKLNIYKVMRF